MRGRKRWIAMAWLFVFLLAGCQADSVNILSKEVGQMNQAEEKKAREIAIQYIQKTYNKEFEVLKVSKSQATGQSYFIKGVIKDKKDTRITVLWELPNKIRDTYVTTLWSEEIKPKITLIAKKYMDVRKLEHIGYSNGTKKDQYTGDVPSVFEMLKNGGDKDYTLMVVADIYKNGGKDETGIRELLKEIKAMNFNEISVTVYVYDDPLKSASKNEDEDKYLLYGYTVSIDDIQKVNIDHLNLSQYKTVYE